MAIIKSSESGGYSQHDYSGRVIEVRRYKDLRNMSDTLDYTDWRTVECCDALVWLGVEGHPGNYEWNPSRPLEFHEQFMWVDCSNHFSDRCGYTLHPEADAWTSESRGDPLMWANLLAWRGHQEALRKEKVAQKEAADVERRERFNAQLAAERAKKQKVEEARLAAETLLQEHAPPKGTVVTYGELTGTVFYHGVKFWYGAWRSTVGVKDERGTAHWLDSKVWAPPPEKKSKKRVKVAGVAG